MKQNKLIRDKIPEIIESKKESAKIHIAGDREYSEKLAEKLQEEVSEFSASKDSEELLDVLEVVYAIAKLNGIDEKTLNLKRKKKAEEKGKFDKRIILDES